MVCLSLMAGGILLISGYRHEERNPYWSEFDESILGLGVDGVVVYQGVNVGKVKNIYVTDKNLAHVEMEVIADKVTLREGVQAELVLWSLATGTMCVSLSGGDPSAPELPPGSEIPSKESLMETVSTEVEKILGDLREIADTVNKGLKGMEDGDIKRVWVDHADELITRGRDFLDSADKTLADVKTDAEGGIKDIREVAQDVRALINDSREAISAARKKIELLEITKTEANVNQALENISELTKRLQKASDDIDKIGRAALHEADNIEYSLRDTLRTLNESLQAVRDLTTYLQQDPSALVRGKGKPSGEKR